MNIKIVFTVSAMLIGIFGAYFPYLRDMFQKKTKPHTYSWLIWTLTQGTAAAGLFYGKGGLPTLSLLLGTLFIFFIFLLSFRYGTRNITASDSILLILALLAIFVWWKLKNPLPSILMVSAIDVIGYFPSFRKTHEDPWSETLTAWVAWSAGNILSIFALSAFNFLTLTYLVSITAANITLIGISLSRRKFVPRNF